MKTKSKDEKADGLRLKYDLATLLKEGVRGKYAKHYEQGTNLVLLSPDAARDFPNDEAVKDLCAPYMRRFKLNKWLKSKY